MKILLSKQIYKFFSDYLPHQKNASINTIKSYRDCFKLFFIFMNTKFNIKPSQLTINDLTKDNIINFLDWLEMERHCSVETRNQRLAAIRSFFHYSQFDIPEYLFEIQAINAIPSKKGVKKEISYIDETSMKILLSKTKHNGKNSLRDSAMLSLLYDGALRVNELIQLLWEDIHFDLNMCTVRVLGKGNKYRIVPISPETGHLLKLLKSKGNGVGIVFINSQHQKLTRKGVMYVINKYVKDANKEYDFKNNNPITCHVFRHSKATHMLNAGIPLIYIRDFLGHSSVKTTEIYAKTNINEKIKTIQKLDKKENPNINDWNEDKELMSWLESL